MKDFITTAVTLLAVIAPPSAVWGGIKWYLNLKSQKPKTDADSRKLDAETSTTYVEEWIKLYREVGHQVRNLEQRIVYMETKEEAYLKQIEGFRTQVATLQGHIAEKDGRIFQLEARVKELERIS